MADEEGTFLKAPHGQVGMSVLRSALKSSANSIPH